MSGVPQRSVLRLALFNNFISDRESGIEFTLSKFVKDTKLWGVADMLNGRDTTQRVHDRVERWAFMKRKAKCKVLYLGRGNSKHKHRLGRQWIKNSPEEKDFGVLADEEL